MMPWALTAYRSSPFMPRRWDGYEKLSFAILAPLAYRCLFS